MPSLARTGPAALPLVLLVSIAVPLAGCGESPLVPDEPEGALDDATEYRIQAANLTDLWVDPRKGSDANSGETRAQALRTLTAAWARIPQGAPLTGAGYRVNLVAGRYPAEGLPVYFEGRQGTADCPILLQSVDGPHAAVLTAGLNLFQCRHVHFLGVDVIPDPPGDAFHAEQCRNLLLREMRIGGGGRQAQETVKMNQCRRIYIEDCDIAGAHDNAVDFVAVQYGWLLRNRIHDAADWAVYVKGGSAYLRLEGNEIFDAGTGGFTAGQGTGLEFMVSPWLHYEAYGIRFINNVVHDTEGAGMGVNGGYNVLLAHNTLYRVGQRSHALEVVFGLRGCDGDVDRCRQYLGLGGWGTALPGREEPIPNRHVFVVNNLLYNPPGYQSRWQHFAIHGPRVPSPGSNIPSPAVTDRDLRIQGNLIWNGPSTLPLGIEDPGQGCQPGNPACSEAQLRAENTLNSLRPQLVSPDTGNFRPRPNGNVFAVAAQPLPSFVWTDAPRRPAAPPRLCAQHVRSNRDGAPRSTPDHPGAY
ncbi:MAG: right-handed parallel beta-helix repeat-containing protein [Armatimonadetes bacterium]|nr:right-handed parallel beta-helix repeat-containing protein [Armatimonadota bacterium]